MARSSPWRLLLRGWRRFAAARETARQRRALRALTDDLLKDIGLSRADVEGG